MFSDYRQLIKSCYRKTTREPPHSDRVSGDVRLSEIAIILSCYKTHRGSLLVV